MNQPYNESTPYINYLSPRFRKRQNCPPQSVPKPVRVNSNKMSATPLPPDVGGLGGGGVGGVTHYLLPLTDYVNW